MIPFYNNTDDNIMMSILWWEYDDNIMMRILWWEYYDENIMIILIVPFYNICHTKYD